MNRYRIGRMLLLGISSLAVVGLTAATVFAQSAGLPTRTNVMLAQPPAPGELVTLSAIVSSVAEDVTIVPNGTVDFFAAPDGYLGSAALATSSLVGIASLSVQLPEGFYYVSAQYNGDAFFAYSYSVPSIPLRVLP